MGIAGTHVRRVTCSLVALTLVAVLAPVAAATAATSFTPGDVVVYRVGTGASLSSASAAVTLDEFGPSGGAAPLESVPLPTAAGSSGNPLTASGTATSEGLLTLSGDGRYLMLSGYATAPGTSSVAGSSATAVPRTVGRVDAAGNVDTTTALTDFANGNNPRSATSSDGTNIWVGGAAGGVRYATLGATTSTSLNSSDTNVREVSVVDGQLYTSADPTKAGSLTVGTVGTGLPTTGGQTISNLTFSPAPAEPYGYAFLTLGTGAGPDTLYLADNSAGAILKYCLVGSTWTEEGAGVPLANVTGLTANDVHGTVIIYATTTSGANGNLYAITDTSGLDGALGGSAGAPIATAPTGEGFRGVAFAPGTTIGSGPGTPPVTPSVTTSDSSLEAVMSDPTNPTLGVTVSDPNYTAEDLTVSATSSNPAVAAGAAVSGAGGQRTLTVTPGNTVGYSTITLTVTAPDNTTATTTVDYGLSAYDGDASDRYHAGAGNASTEIDVGDGYMVVADDLSNVLRLYKEDTSGPAVASFDFTSQLPSGTTSIDIEAAARNGNTIYWFGSMSNSDSGNERPAASTMFATEVSGSGQGTTLTYLGSYAGLRQDLINWDVANGSPLGLSDSASGDSKTASGLNVEGFEFAPGSTTTGYLAFRAPLEPTTNRSAALLVPVTDIPSLIGAPAGSATFGAPIEMNLGGLALREMRRNAHDQYLLIAGTADGSNSTFHLYTWDGKPGDAPTLTGTSVPQIEDGAWEGIVSVPDPLVDGAAVNLVEDNGDTAWYSDASTSKSGLPTGLQKDLDRTFTVSLPAQTVQFTSTPPSPGAVGGTYDVSATASSGLPVTLSIDAASTGGACTLSGSTVTFGAPGTCVIDADQAGNESFAPAPTAQQTVAVAGPPSATISTPTEGATYGENQVVDASYSCADGPNGPGISSCADSQGVGNGKPIHTSTPGDYTFAVTATSRDGATSTSTVSYTVVPVANTIPPVITGAPVDGQVLNASTGSFTSPSKLKYSYQWEDCTDATLESCTPTGKATSNAYKLTTADVGDYVTVVVTATDKAGDQGQATAQPVGPVAAPSAPTYTEAPALSGTAADGQALKTSKGTWSSPDKLTYTYQWVLCSDVSGDACTPISGATHTSYKLTSADVGLFVTAVVTATDQEGQTGHAQGTPEQVSPPPPPSNMGLPVISGNFATGKTLRTTKGSWSSPDDLTYTYQWQRCEDSGTCTNIDGANAQTYKLTGADTAGQVTVVVSATDGEGRATQATAQPVGGGTAAS